MKNNKSRSLARGTIVAQSFGVCAIPVTVVLLLDWLVFKIPVLVPIFFLITQPVLSTLLAMYRLRQGHDRKLLQKWQKKYQERISNRKTEIQNRKEQVRTEHYAFGSVISVTNVPCVFQIRFVNKIIKRAMPVVSVNNKVVALRMIDDFNAFCYAEKAITADDEVLIFRSGSFEYKFNNPYFIWKDISEDGIMWQCEGHTKEKNIYIDESYLPHRNNSCYAFNFFINGKRIAECHGWHVASLRAIVVNIGNFNKRRCIGKDCFLKPVFDVSKKIVLPKPVVLLVNGTPKEG